MATVYYAFTPESQYYIFHYLVIIMYLKPQLIILYEHISFFVNIRIKILNIKYVSDDKKI